MKKQISIEGEGLAALNTIVSSESFTSRADARKVHAVSQWLLAPMKLYTTKVEAIQDEYGEEVPDAIPEGAPEGYKPKIKMVVPDAKVEAYKKAIEDAKNEKYVVQFDRESFSFCNGIVDRVFERPEIKKQNGLAGVDQAKNIEQISVAFEQAVDVK